MSEIEKAGFVLFAFVIACATLVGSLRTLTEKEVVKCLQVTECRNALDKLGRGE